MSATPVAFALAERSGRVVPLLRPWPGGDGHAGKARHHLAVVEAARQQPVLPLRTLRSWSDQADAYLRAHQEMLLAALQRVRGCVEVVVSIDTDRRDRAVAPSPDPVSPLCAGRSYLRRLADDAAGEADRRASVARLVAEVSGEAAAVGAAVSALPGPDPTRPILGLLTTRLGAAPLAAAIAGLASGAAAQGSRLRLSGPWPPYLFAAQTLAGSPMMERA